MHDNKVRLSADILEKAELIATEWGLKNARAAVEAVFRRYSDDYLHGRQGTNDSLMEFSLPGRQASLENRNHRISCEAMDELEDLLAM